MLTIADLKNVSDKDTLWDLLKSDTLRAKLCDLILDAALNSKPSEVDRLTTPALRAYAARVEFARDINSLLPRSPEALRERAKTVLPTPVE